MSTLQDDIGLLNTLLNNLKKSINKNFTVTTLQAKLNYANELYNQIERGLLEEEDTIPDTELTFLIKASRNSISEIRNILKLKFEQLNTKPQVTMPFDYKVATSIVQPYDGTADGIDAFLDSANLLKDLTEANQQATAARFLKTRLTGKARLGLPERLATIDDIIADVKTRCEDKTTPENILAKLKAVKQKDTAEKFCDEVERLTIKLKAVYLNSGIPDTVSTAMSTKAGVDTLINGIGSAETKLILKAGTFKDMKEATQKVLENTANTSCQSAQLLTFKSRQTQHNYKGRFNSNRNDTTRFFKRGQYNAQPNYHGNNLQFRNSFPHNTNNYYQNRGRGGRYHTNSRRQIFTTDAIRVHNTSIPNSISQDAGPQSHTPPVPTNFHQLDLSRNIQSINNDNFLDQHMMQVNPHRLT